MVFSGPGETVEYRRIFTESGPILGNANILNVDFSGIMINVFIYLHMCIISGPLSAKHGITA